jgi:hypothetical protein
MIDFQIDFMSSTTYYLDEIRHTNYNCNLQLDIQCSLEISSPHGHLFPFSLIFQRLDSIISSGVWVAGGSRLRLSLQVIGTDFCCLQFDQNAFADSLRDVICQAEVAFKHKYPAMMTD